MPRGDGITTTDIYDFSDSPTGDPALPGKLRYAYGRPNADTSTYGTLKYSHGLLVSQTASSIEGTVSSVQKSYSGYTKEAQQALKSGDITLVQDLFNSADTYVEQFQFLLTAIPIPFSSKNPVDSDVFLRIANPVSFPLASGTASLSLNGEVQQGLVVEPFFLGNGGLNVTWSNVEHFEYGSQVDVHWVFEDTDVPPNKIVIEYWFRTVEDRVGPRITSISPTASSEGVLISASILFDLTDAEAGVDISSLKLYVNGVLIETTNPNLTILEISEGFRIGYDPPTDFLYGDFIPVVILVSDLSAHTNTTFFTWSFTTELSPTPLLLEQYPPPCATGVQRIGNISFEVIDGGGGLLRESITMSIDSSERGSVILVPIVRRLE